MTHSQGPWPGRFVWHDLMTTDAEKSAAFYAALFGWDIEARDVMGHTYREIHAGPGPIGGVIEEKNIPASHWMPYVAVSDVDATAEKITAHGGSVCVPPTDIPGTGRFCVVGDPQGAYFSIYRGDEGKHGAEPDLLVHGRPCWNEALVADDDAAQAFYTAVFGWQDLPKDLGPMGTYHRQMLGDAQVGGLMKNPMNGAPSCWLVYFHAADLAATTQKAKDLGATALVENEAVPDIGSFSMLQDPMGAVFALFGGPAT